MNRLLVLLTVCLASFFLASCEQLPQLDYDSEYQFQDSYQYAWLPSQKMDMHPIVSELTINRTQKSIDNNLTAKNWKRVSEEEAEILVHAFITVETKIESTSYYTSYGLSYYHPHHFAGVSTTDIRSYQQGTLVVDLVDAKTKNLVWRGSFGSRIRTGLSPQEHDKLIDDTVVKILSAYPHGAKKPVE